MNRNQISDLIYKHLKLHFSALKKNLKAKKTAFPYFYVDDLLPEELANKLFKHFPETHEMMHKKSLRENKYVGFKMDEYDPVLEECIYAFHDPKIVDLISQIFNLKNVMPDAIYMQADFLQWVKTNF